MIAGSVAVGCEGKGRQPRVPVGEFTARVQGSLSDTLSGTALYRRSDQGLVGVELGSQNGTGLSIELEPHPPSLRSYEVVEAELFGVQREGQPPGVMAFLTVDEGDFAAVDGTFELTYVDDEQIGATFTFEMEGTFEGAAFEHSSIQVTGKLNAPPK